MRAPRRRPLGRRGRRAALRPARLAVRLVVTRHWRTTPVGPYAVVTVEVEPERYETSVTWGEGGAEVEPFAVVRRWGDADAEAAHDALCERIERELGAERRSAARPPAA